MNFVTYSNEAKQEILGVQTETLEKFGAVSEECASEMAKGLMQKTGCDVALCTTGIAGPTGGTDEKPVGLMYSTIYSKEKNYIVFVSPISKNIPLNKKLLKPKML